MAWRAAARCPLCLLGRAHRQRLVSSSSGAATAAGVTRSEITYAFCGVVYVGLTNESSCRLTMLDANGPGFEFPPGTGFQPLPVGFEPTAEQAADAALATCRALDVAAGGAGSSPREIVFAGLGEPLLRLPELCGAMRRLVEWPEHVSRLRLNSNGLTTGTTASQTARQLAAAGLSSACIQIQSADPEQHRALMQPLHAALGLANAMELAEELLLAGVEVECSVIARPEVNLEAAEEAAIKLGATFKARPFYP